MKKKHHQHKHKHNIYKDEMVRSNFDKLVQKIQKLFSVYKRSRHVVFTPANLRMLYILYLCKIQERTQHFNHKCHLCIIYNRHEILTMDVNTRFPSNDILNSYMKHAEINAIHSLHKLNPQSRSCGIFITRFNRSSELNYSGPCYYCARSIKKYMGYFHSISYTDAKEELVVLTPSEFKNTEFLHITKYHTTSVRPYV